MAAFGARTALWVRRRSKNFYPSSAPVPGPSSDLPAPGQNTPGNWQFSTMSTAGMPPLTIAGSISQSGSSLSGAVHVDGSSCFDQRTAIALTGTLTNGNVSLTSTAVDGQVITLAGSITEKSGFPGFFDRDIYHQWWLCRWRPRKQRRLQCEFTHRLLGRQLDDCWRTNDPLGYPTQSERPHCGGQFWSQRAFHFRRCLRQVGDDHAGNVSLCQLHHGHVRGP